MDSQPHILFVDDEPLLHNLTQRLFPRHGMQVTSCTNAQKAIELLQKDTFDLVVTDFMMPGMDGGELLGHIRAQYPGTRVIMITAHASVQHAVRTMQTGAIDYIAKPFSIDILVERVKANLKKKVDPSQGTRPATSSATPSPDDCYVGDHPVIRQLKNLLPRISTNQAPVFIQGESGTGKEILARLIHDMSDRAPHPYITINCANLPRELVESHLFGHLKGSFTGATENRTGAFERAHRGTLLLDEITEIELSLQAKLLRVLQEKEIQKVGSTELHPVDVRIIATSNRHVQEAVAEGQFREDLYHRLCVFPLTVPPLRERATDIDLLARHFVEKYCTLYGLPAKQIAPALMQQFAQYHWPGNVRELENMVQRGVLLSADRNVVEQDDVFNVFFATVDTAPAATVDTDADETLETMEYKLIMQTLEKTTGNQQKAAEQLGISARTIRNKLKKYRDMGWLT